MVDGPDFVRSLRNAGFDFFTGVPCSLVKGVIATLEERGGYIAETREDAAVGLAAGACAGNGILLDISDPVNPVRLDQVIDSGFAYWHSATFNNDGSKVIFTDEWGGGGRPRCRALDLLGYNARRKTAPATVAPCRDNGC